MIQTFFIVPLFFYFNKCTRKKHKLNEIILIAQEKSLFNLFLISRKKDTKNKERKKERKKEKEKEKETYPLLTKPFLFFFLTLIHMNRTI